MIPRKNDILWKTVLDEIFEDLLRFLRKDADEVYDLKRGFTFMDKELAELDPEPDDPPDTRFADKLVKVFHKDGKEEWVLLHIEIQGDTSLKLEFSKRMFTYFYRILDKYKCTISAIAIFTGPNGPSMPKKFEYEFHETSLTYAYETLSVVELSEDRLINSDNPFAQVLLVAKTSLLEGRLAEEELLKQKIIVGKHLLQQGFVAKKTRAIIEFLDNTIRFEKKELNHIFDKEIKENDKLNIMNLDDYIKMMAREDGLEEGRELGLEQGREQGREEGRRMVRWELVENLLKGSKHTDEEIAAFVNVSVEFVEEVKGSLVLQ